MDGHTVVNVLHLSSQYLFSLLAAVDSNPNFSRLGKALLHKTLSRQRNIACSQRSRRDLATRNMFKTSWPWRVFYGHETRKIVTQSASTLSSSESTLVGCQDSPTDLSLTNCPIMSTEKESINVMRTKVAKRRLEAIGVWRNDPPPLQRTSTSVSKTEPEQQGHGQKGHEYTMQFFFLDALDYNNKMAHEDTQDGAQHRWAAEMSVTTMYLPGLMKAGLYVSQENEDKHFSRSGWMLEDLTKARVDLRIYKINDPGWAGRIRVIGADQKALTDFRLHHLTPERVYKVLFNDKDGRKPYAFDASKPENNFNYIHDDLLLDGLWPWPKAKKAEKMEEKEDPFNDDFEIVG